VQGARAVTTGNKESQISPPAQPLPGSAGSRGPRFESPLGCREPCRALADETVVARDGLALRPSWEPSPIGGTIATLAGCATHKKQPQSADAHEIAHGTRRDTPGRADTGWDDVAASAQLEGLAEARAGPLRTARAQFRSRWGNPWGFESPRSHDGWRWAAPAAGRGAVSRRGGPRRGGRGWPGLAWGASAAEAWARRPCRPGA
jgi:hypothetical protein